MVFFQTWHINCMQVPVYRHLLLFKSFLNRVIKPVPLLFDQPSYITVKRCVLTQLLFCQFQFYCRPVFICGRFANKLFACFIVNLQNVWKCNRWTPVKVSIYMSYTFFCHNYIFVLEFWKNQKISFNAIIMVWIRGLASTESFWP